MMLGVFSLGFFCPFWQFTVPSEQLTMTKCNRFLNQNQPRIQRSLLSNTNRSSISRTAVTRMLLYRRMAPGKWAIVYAWYYPKGPVFTETGLPGQRHFWSYIVVWTDSPKPNHSTIQGVTIPTEVGYEMQVPPKEDFIFEQATVKVESYLNSENQAVQLTDESGEIQDLITWEQLTDQARAALSEFDFNIKWAYVDMVMPLKDDVFSTILEESFPF
ncbi:hypothetical protein L914_15941 [Phytophthora nicotianae]|uniref:Necrosis inducing protein NPP1 n=1 Tax=Phytophthora nicotianae TaxID=4792 RepID=W2MMC2_PHYNI|nr:hypothetical protein L914_15941 [Phytophthora nicotianae]